MNAPTTCGKCHRPLSDPKSIERGYGPDCWASIQGESRKDASRPATEAAKSDYDWHIAPGGRLPVIVIEDLDRGGMSVTNNADAVFAAVLEDAGVKPEDVEVIYRDSEGNYDGLFLLDGKVKIYALQRFGRITDEAEAIKGIKWADAKA
ncbi:MAG: hypothetical protein BWY85_00216 [Firmicutes bacterium ADurb.Bin506]|nr:MAG: hypothetical protein BWY85_00216 [Firmicutes bacterium ADurb.Bin506]